MRFCTKALLVMLLLVAPSISLELRAQDYAIEELIEETATAPKPFSILRVDPFNGGMRLFLSTSNPRGIADLLAAGALEAQFSGDESETNTSVPLSLGKAVLCIEDDEPRYLAFKDPTPRCEDKTQAHVEYFLKVPAVLGPGRDLAIGQDPDFLWLIEER